IHQEYEMIDLSRTRPGITPQILPIKVERVKTVTTDSKTDSRDGAVNVQHSVQNYVNNSQNARLVSADGHVQFSSKDPFNNFTSGQTIQNYIVKANQAKLQSSITDSWSDSSSRYLNWVGNLDDTSAETIPAFTRPPDGTYVIVPPIIMAGEIRDG